MSVRSLIRAWNEFFFEPQSPTPICLFRVLYGLLALANFILLRPDWLTWFGTRGIYTLDTMRKFEPGTRINLFVFLPNDLCDPGILLVRRNFGRLCHGRVCRREPAAWLCFSASRHIDQRALFAMHSGDTLLRVTGFWVMFAPAGAAFSVDRLMRLWKGKEGLEIRPRAPWAQRMIQFQVAILYLDNLLVEDPGSDLDQRHGAFITSTTWINSSGFPLPSFLQDPVLIKLETWFTLAIEFALGVLIWFKELRYPLLAAGRPVAPVARVLDERSAVPVDHSVDLRDFHRTRRIWRAPGTGSVRAPRRASGRR